MGADVIYMQRKATPRIAVVIIAWAVLLALSMFAFNGPSLASWLTIVVSFVGILLYLGLEYRHASKLAKGYVDTVRVSDLTKAIYWLSIVSSRKAPTQETFYYRNVAKVVHRMGGRMEIEWNEIFKKYKPLNLRMYIFLSALGVAGVVGSTVGQSLHILWIEWLLIGLALASLLALAITYKKSKDNIESFIRDEQTNKLTRVLAEDLISWTSERTKQPLQVMLAQTNYSDTKIVDSIYGVAIVKIEPRNILTQSEKQAQPLNISTSGKEALIDDAQEKWEPLSLVIILIGTLSSVALLELSLPFLNWIFNIFYGSDIAVLVAAIAIIALPFAPIEIFFRRKHLTSPAWIVLPLIFILLGVPTLQWLGLNEQTAWMTFGTTFTLIGLIILTILTYLALPFLKIIFRGGNIRPSDISDIVKRVPKWSVRRMLAQNEGTGQRFAFIVALYGMGTMKLEDAPESMRKWINEDATQPDAARYFVVKDGSVGLTRMGESLSKVLEKKLAQR